LNLVSVLVVREDGTRSVVTGMYLHIYIYIYVYMYIYKYTYTNAHTLKYIYTCIYI
jgi:hypothetical protein